MNTVTCNNISAQFEECCLFIPKGNESQSLASTVGPSAAAFNFNLQPYKFPSIKSDPENMRPENITDKKTEFNRFIAFGKSLALAGNSLY